VAPLGAFEPITAFAAAYRGGTITPADVAERVLGHIQSSDRLVPPMRFFIALDPEDVRKQASLASERLRSGHPLSLLDGVPVAVKDELDQRGYPTTVGTRFLGRTPATQDAAVVAALRRAGAVLLGKTNMHEIGIGVTGINPHHGAVRNPYNPMHVTGGSSSGSAACVAAGICPLAVGADGGGSIRIPAAFCGVVGLKPTFGLLSEDGAAQLCWSVAHVGPIAATVKDAALGFACMTPSSGSAASHALATLTHWLQVQDFRGVRVGFHPGWFEDTDPAVERCCQEALRMLREAGAGIVEAAQISLEELRLARTVHVVTIVSEMATAHLRHHAEHRTEYSDEVRFNLALSQAITATDYLHAQRLRARLARLMREVFGQIDVLATPTTACTAPLLSQDALLTGESNVSLMERIMRFAVVANLTGLPAITVPAGYDGAGLPVGFQLMARPHEEGLLLGLAHEVERRTERMRPRVHFPVLAKT